MGVLIPLRNPLRELTPTELLRNAPTMRVRGIGAEGQSRLLAARVLVVGAGGLGSAAISYLAAAGVGHLTICDFDVVELSNLQRQILHSQARIGNPKTASARLRVHEINPDCTVDEVETIDTDNVAQLLADHDLVLDCADSFSTKYLIADAADTLQRPLVFGTAVGAMFQVSVFWSVQNAGFEAVCLRDLYPMEPAPGTSASSDTEGILGAVCGQAGSVMAAEAIKLITGAGEPLLGKILVGNALLNTWDTVVFSGSA